MSGYDRNGFGSSSKGDPYQTALDKHCSNNGTAELRAETDLSDHYRVVLKHVIAAKFLNK